jgi:membrane fusion protein, multidrug efflux system
MQLRVKSNNIRAINAATIVRFALATTAALALASCGPRNVFVAPPLAKVVVAQPLQKPVTLYFELTGNTAPFRTANLVARVQGYLESIDYKDGAAVTKGTKLFLIERDIYQAALEQAQAQLAHDKAVLAEAQVDLTRYRTLQTQKAIPSQQAEDQAFIVDQNKATVDIDNANVKTASINLGYTLVLAPFDGVMLNHQVDIGNLVGASGPTTLATIIQVDPLYVNFTVSEAQALALLALRGSVIEAGRTRNDLTPIWRIPVEIGLQDEEGYPHKGHLDYVSEQVDSASGTLSMRGLFENKNRMLLAGLFVRVRIPIERQDKAILTRDDAIGTSQEGSYVLVVGANNVVQRKIVKTGQNQGRLRIIQSGLEPTDWVVIEGVQQAFPGAKVEPQRTDLTSPGSEPGEAVTSAADPARE